MDAWLSPLLLAGACALWIVNAERRRDQRRRAALAIAERVMRLPPVKGAVSPKGERGVAVSSTCETLATST